VRRVKELGGEVRKIQWVGRIGAPDRVVMLPASPGVLDLDYPGNTVWVELKNPKTILTFPHDARERAQAREHNRMRKMGQHVEVIGTIDQVEELLQWL